MKINEATYDETRTSSVVNLAVLDGPDEQGEIFRAIQRTYRIRMGSGTGSARLFRAVFGRAQTVKDYSSRNYVWTFLDPSSGVVLYVLVSKEGAAFEYDFGSVGPWGPRRAGPKVARVINWVARKICRHLSCAKPKGPKTRRKGRL